MSNLTPCLKKFAEGQSAASKIFALLDRVPKIIQNLDGKKLDNLQGIIKFENVVFAYPK
jgi:ATP-binding cassette subfamily B (MDR/TAP) protein 1